MSSTNNMLRVYCKKRSKTTREMESAHTGKVSALEPFPGLMNSAINNRLITHLIDYSVPRWTEEQHRPASLVI